MKTRTEAGFSLIETVFAIGVLSVGALGMAGIFASGMQKVASSPNELLSTQKAAEAIESVYSARDSHLLTWSQLRNVSNGGVFKDGPQPMTTAGPDGVVDTADDGPVETVILPGPDQKMGTADDITKTLTGLTRTIAIADISPPLGDVLRSVTVTITYLDGATTRTYVLTGYISSFA
jgi:type II secretory pathway pseudopilin PulG